MPKAFSIVSWDVEHFRDDAVKVADVVGLLAALQPDVFALYEVEGKSVFKQLTEQMPKQ